jgi:anti-anti-sigma factor
MTNFNITERKNRAVIILDLKGKILFGEGNVELHNALRHLARKGVRKILLNFAEVTHVDSSGLGELVGGYVAIKKNEGQIKLSNLSQHIRKLIEVTKLSTVFEIYESETEAVKSFNRRAKK